MKTLSRDSKVGIAILLLLLLVTIFAATRRQVEARYPPLSTLSAAPDGALALKLWMQALHYDVNEAALEDFLPPKDASIVFMLEPQFPAQDELEIVDEWVERGGTLILIGEGYGTFSTADHFGFALEYLGSGAGSAKVESPILLSPLQLDLEHANVRFALQAEREDYVALAVYDGKPVLVLFDQGKGRVILGTLPRSFMNIGLKEDGNPELVLNVVALARDPGMIWFDEWHHGLQGGSQITGPAEFLRRNPVGRALLFVTFTVFLAFFLQGRGFGRPVPLPQDLKRRGAMEHVTGIANLNRRAAHRAGVLTYYHNQIKRKLGHRYRLDPAMNDEDYVNSLAGYNPSVDKNDLLNLLKRLKRRDVRESEMVVLAGEAAKWIDT
jgi:hypothetical protein